MAINTLQAPINYMDMYPKTDPAGGFADGYKIGDAIRARQAEYAALEEKRAALERYRAGVAYLQANPTQANFVAFMLENPGQHEAIKTAAGIQKETVTEQQFGEGLAISTALENGAVDVARYYLSRQVEAHKNSQKPTGIYGIALDAIDSGDVKRAQASINLALSAIDADKFAKSVDIMSAQAKAQKEKYEANNTPQRLDLENRYKKAEIRNLDSQIRERAGRLDLDRDKIQSETEWKLYELNQKTNPALNLGGDAKKIINDSTVASVAADQLSSSMLNLAGQLEKSDASYGAFGSVSEWLKKTTGKQDAMTQMRQEYVRIRSSQVSKMLPPGAASDTDISLAMAGFPPDTANANTMASFLRGMAKLNTYTAMTENAKAEWVNSVGHLGKPKTDINVDGINVPAGSTFTDFARQYIDSKVAQRKNQQAQSQLQSRSYMRHAQGAQ